MTLKTCPVCLTIKDTEVKEVYPFPDDHIVLHPIDPLMEMDVQPDDCDTGKWRRIAVCHQCYHRLQPDMWISEECLRQVQCKTPFTELPLLDDV